MSWVGKGCPGMVLVPDDRDAKEKLVIIHGVATCINVKLKLIDIPESFLWINKCKKRTLSSPPGSVCGSFPPLRVGCLPFQCPGHTPPETDGYAAIKSALLAVFERSSRGMFRHAGLCMVRWLPSLSSPSAVGQSYQNDRLPPLGGDATPPLCFQSPRCQCARS